ncbi:MAG: hypothetical protein Q4F06_09640 [Eubacteriales bacterium]|nr:hypothetical protein [Eubacteriales bacterium]
MKKMQIYKTIPKIIMVFLVNISLVFTVVGCRNAQSKQDDNEIKQTSVEDSIYTDSPYVWEIEPEFEKISTDEVNVLEFYNTETGQFSEAVEKQIHEYIMSWYSNADDFYDKKNLNKSVWNEIKTSNIESSNIKYNGKDMILVSFQLDKFSKTMLKDDRINVILEKKENEYNVNYMWYSGTYRFVYLPAFA